MKSFQKILEEIDVITVHDVPFGKNKSTDDMKKLEKKFNLKFTAKDVKNAEYDVTGKLKDIKRLYRDEFKMIFYKQL